MIKRRVQQELQRVLRKTPVLVIFGPRNTGKAFWIDFLKNRSKKDFALLDCSKPADQRKLTNPELYFSSRPDVTIILQEIQFLPRVFQAVLKHADARKPGRFILTLSAAPAAELAAGFSNPLFEPPLVGQKPSPKIALREWQGISWKEAQAHRIPMATHWFRGGYPNALMARSDKAFLQWAGHFLHHYIYTELPSFTGPGFVPDKTMACLRMLASANTSLLNLEELARSMGSSGPTAKKYLSLLVATGLIRLLEPLPSPAHQQKRLSRSPRIYLRDTGLLHYLAGIRSQAELGSHIQLGGSWETYVVNEIIKSLPPRVSSFFYRTQHGAGADLVLVKNKRPIACINISLSNEPVPGKGFRQSVADLKTKWNFLVFPGQGSRQMGQNLHISSLEWLLDKHLPVIL